MYDRRTMILSRKVCHRISQTPFRRHWSPAALTMLGRVAEPGPSDGTFAIYAHVKADPGE